MKLFSFAVYPDQINWRNPDILSSPFVILRDKQANAHLKTSIETTLLRIKEAKISEELITRIRAQTLCAIDRAVPTPLAELVQDILDTSIILLNKEQIQALQKGHEGAQIKKIIADAEHEYLNYKVNAQKEIMFTQRQFITDQIVTSIRPIFARELDRKKIEEEIVQFHFDHPGFYSFCKDKQIFVLETDCLAADTPMPLLREQLKNVFHALITNLKDKTALSNVFSEPELYLEPMHWSVALAPPALPVSISTDEKRESKLPALGLFSPSPRSLLVKIPTLEEKSPVSQTKPAETSDNTPAPPSTQARMGLTSG